MIPPRPMPRRDEVHPDFDGHLERPFESLTPEERLEWVWECMQLLHTGARARGELADATSAPLAHGAKQASSGG